MQKTVIGFTGFCKADIILYISRILKLLGERVVIIDQSNQNEFRFSVPDGFSAQDNKERSTMAFDSINDELQLYTSGVLEPALSFAAATRSYPLKLQASGESEPAISFASESQSYPLTPQASAESAPAISFASEAWSYPSQFQASEESEPPAGFNMFIIPEHVNYRGIDVLLSCENAFIEDLQLEDYTTLIVDFGVNFDAINRITNLKALFIVTDCCRHHTIPLSSCLSHIEKKPDAIRILRDITNMKINSRYIDSILQSSQFTNIIAKYELPLVENDYTSRLKSQYDDVFKFTKISKDLNNLLMDCIMGLYEADKKVFLKAFGKAKKGG